MEAHSHRWCLLLVHLPQACRLFQTNKDIAQWFVGSCLHKERAPCLTTDEACCRCMHIESFGWACLQACPMTCVYMRWRTLSLCVSLLSLCLWCKVAAAKPHIFHNREECRCLPCLPLPSYDVLHAGRFLGTYSWDLCTGCSWLFDLQACSWPTTVWHRQAKAPCVAD